MSEEPPKYVKAKPLQLSRNATTDAVLAAILGACWSHAIANTAAALDGRDPEGVHQMRVGLRRLRSALSLFKKALDNGQTDWVTGEAKWVLSWLGPARDWDVLITEKLHSVRLGFPDDPSLLSLEKTAKRHRSRAYSDLRKKIASERFQTFRKRFPDWLEAHGWKSQTGPNSPLLRRPAVKLASKLLNRRHKKAVKLGEDFASLSVPDRHRVRIELKKLRYACEFFRSLYENKRVPLYLDALKQMQDDLGHLNDVAVAENLLADLPASSKRPDTQEALKVGRGIMMGWYGKAVADAEPKLLDDWDKLTGMNPFWR